MSDPIASSSERDLRVHVERALAAHYELEQEIGRGGMGIVYCAKDRRLKRTVAVKLLPPELAFRSEIRSRFLREAETAAQLSHPNIVPIYTVGEQDGLVFFVMAYVDGPTVARRVHDRGRLDPAEVRRILTEVAEALAYAHGRGVIHRDIKPDNILLDKESGRAMVTDFGIARAAIEGSDSRLTATGMALGTPAYMSPEQCAGERELDGRSDLYSLGIVGYLMLTGTLPFEASSTAAMLVKQLTEKPEPVSRRRPDAPKDLARTIMRLLEKDPEHRFADGAVLIDALAGRSVPAPPPDASGAAARQLEPIGEAQRTKGGVLKRYLGLEEIERSLGEFGDAMEDFGLDTLDGSDERRARRAAKRQAERARDIAHVRESRSAKRRERHPKKIPFEERPLPDRIRSVRRQTVSYFATTGMLFGINILTAPEFLWAFFPAFGMAIGLVTRVGSLWAEGVRLRHIFDPGAYAASTGSTPGALPEAGSPRAAGSGSTSSSAEGAALPGASSAHTPAAPYVEDGVTVDRPVIDGPRGAALRQAIADRRAIRELVERLGAADRALLPDVQQTADALLKQMLELANELHRLEVDSPTGRLREMDVRLADLERDAGGAPDPRRIEMLRRQRASLRDLLESRQQLERQFESAALLLQNLALDVLRLRTAGVQSVLDDVTSVTQEARALAGEISAVLRAAEEIRSIGR